MTLFMSAFLTGSLLAADELSTITNSGEVSEIAIAENSVPEPVTDSKAMGDLETTALSSAEVAAATTISPMITVRLNTPYSLQDCINLVEEAMDALVNARGEISRIDLVAMNDVLDAVADYLQERDDLHSNLLGYSWEEIGRHQIRNSENNTFTYFFRDFEIPRGITALSFEVERADSNLEKVEVFDSKGNLVGPYSSQMVLRHSFPRRYVYHLYQPTEIQTLRITASQMNPEANRTPQLIILAGRSDKTEHGKLAIYYILQAEEQIANNDIKTALETLQDARREIMTFRQQARR